MLGRTAADTRTGCVNGNETRTTVGGDSAAQYLECKLILRPNHFTSRQSLWDFAKVLRKPAAQNGVKFSTDEFQDSPLQIREVLFMDTADFRLYNNAFILRRRIPYEDGFPAGDPEIVFKFRHPDIQVAAETDVRPQIFGDYRIKFKCEALPLKNELGGIRLLFSHNVEFPLSHVHEGDPTSFDTITRVFPVLQKLKKEPGEHVALVGETSSKKFCRTSASWSSARGCRPRLTLPCGAHVATTAHSSASSPSRSSSRSARSCASAILWYLLRHVADTNPIWAIASMIAASEPVVKEAARLFRARIINVLVGCAVGLVFLLVDGSREWKLPLALAATVFVSSYLINIKTMWRQAPITAAIVIASGLTHNSKLTGIEHGLHKVGEVLLGCLMGLAVSWAMSKIWPLSVPGPAGKPA